ncbi:hypothetical protein Bind_1736 [Beijerinckia indica subsp. indica ATCC 9039]|uniref:Uncharacterized protein n=1 Tax=Beijerinckia indica subsp. indica (strain ATCC 9039 / DSM 1715 / NCIMB 8712) TaxID=395963 RepID=B2ICU2_BEII9|nr:hypothetical protein Bind_1736 [Beijerinckia indica subsp. indica ATCC 9039]
MERGKYRYLGNLGDGRGRIHKHRFEDIIPIHGRGAGTLWKIIQLSAGSALVKSPLGDAWFL